MKIKQMKKIESKGKQNRTLLLLFNNVVFGLTYKKRNEN